MSSAKAGVHVHDVVTQNDFVKMRSERDKALDVPTLILRWVQIKHARVHSRLPRANGVSYLKLPLNAL
jgi:hypothetical protein